MFYIINDFVSILMRKTLIAFLSSNDDFFYFFKKAL